MSVKRGIDSLLRMSARTRRASVAPRGIQPPVPSRALDCHSGRSSGPTDLFDQFASPWS